MYTIKKKIGRLTNLNVVFTGDLLYGRTVHSLIKALRLFDSNKFFGISPSSLSLPKELEKDDYNEAEIKDLPDIKPDIIYATRIQKERMKPDERDKFSYEINKKTLGTVSEKTLLMHPLPRINELNVDIEKDPRFVPFIQARCGIHTRMAILAILLGHEDYAV